jgi:hypothetical protein
MPKRTVIVKDKMQKRYRYVRTAAVGRNCDPDFKPQLTPQQMLRLGVFGGKYMTDTRKEFPKSWFTRARLSPRGRDCSLNFFGVDASQPLSVWRRKDGCTPTIRAAGSNGTAATTWAAACRPKTGARSSDGKPYAGISGRSSGIASRAT